MMHLFSKVDCVMDDKIHKLTLLNLILTKTNLINNSLTIEFREPFKPRRGRINCSLNDNGKWRWFGVQFPIKVNIN